MIEVDETKYNNMRESIQLLIDIGFDYDGFHKSEDLKVVIDDLVELARGALDGKSPEEIWGYREDNKE